MQTETKVTIKSGNIQNPQKYFDIETFYKDSEEPDWQHIGYGVYAQKRKGHIPDNHKVGHIVRELSAFRMLELPDGSIFCDNNGKPIAVQVPTSKQEY